MGDRIRADRDWVAWRARRLAAAGFTPAQAQALAHDPGVDLHQLLELIDRGCPRALAVRITAPLEPVSGP